LIGTIHELFLDSSFGFNGFGFRDGIPFAGALFVGYLGGGFFLSLFPPSYAFI